MQRIDPKQIQLIHIAQAQLGLDDVAYRAIIAGRTGGKKESSRDLTYAEADAVINYMVTQGFVIKRKYVTRERGAWRRKRFRHLPADVILLPTIDQMEMIEALAKKITWRYQDGYERWRRKYMKIDRIITAQQASDVIEGLKGMLDNQEDASWK